MEMKRICVCFFWVGVFLWIFESTENVFAADIVEIPVKNKITLVEITSEGCKPCEEMLPVIDKVKKDYHGQVAFVIVDFWKNPKVVRKIGTNTSPTIIIFDKNGNEFFRHYGYIAEKELVFHINKVTRP